MDRIPPTTPEPRTDEKVQAWTEGVMSEMEAYGGAPRWFWAISSRVVGWKAEVVFWLTLVALGALLASGGFCATGHCT